MNDARMFIPQMRCAQLWETIKLANTLHWRIDAHIVQLLFQCNIQAAFRIRIDLFFQDLMHANILRPTKGEMCTWYRNLYVWREKSQLFGVLFEVWQEGKWIESFHFFWNMQHPSGTDSTVLHAKQAIHMPLYTGAWCICSTWGNE